MRPLLGSFRNVMCIILDGAFGFVFAVCLCRPAFCFSLVFAATLIVRRILSPNPSGIGLRFIISLSSIDPQRHERDTTLIVPCPAHSVANGTPNWILGQGAIVGLFTCSRCKNARPENITSGQAHELCCRSRRPLSIRALHSARDDDFGLHPV